jgi:DNA polymerase III delta subunit
VREGDVRELVSRAQEHKGYELSDAVADHQPIKATRVLEELLQDGVNEGALLATIATKYRRMAVAREMLDARSSRSEIARKLGMNDNYGLTRLLEQVGMIDMDAIKSAYELLTKADADPKTGRMDARLALELAVCELSAAPSRARSRSPV